jgi:hypothetical protein
MRQGHVCEGRAARHAAVEGLRARGVDLRTVVAGLADGTANARGIDGLLPARGAVAVDHTAGVGAHGIPVRADRPHVDPGAERGHLVARHGGAEVTAAPADLLVPAPLVEDLTRIAGVGIDADVLGARDVPEKPHDGVEAVRPGTELIRFYLAGSTLTTLSASSAAPCARAKRSRSR